MTMTGTGVLPSQALRQMIDAGTLAADPAIIPEQIQPASVETPRRAPQCSVQQNYMQKRRCPSRCNG